MFCDLGSLAKSLVSVHIVVTWSHQSYLIKFFNYFCDFFFFKVHRWHWTRLKVFFISSPFVQMCQSNDQSDVEVHKTQRFESLTRAFETSQLDIFESVKRAQVEKKKNSSHAIFGIKNKIRIAAFGIVKTKKLILVRSSCGLTLNIVSESSWEFNCSLKFSSKFFHWTFHSIFWLNGSINMSSTTANQR